MIAKYHISAASTGRIYTRGVLGITGNDGRDGGTSGSALGRGGNGAQFNFGAPQTDAVAVAGARGGADAQGRFPTRGGDGGRGGAGAGGGIQLQAPVIDLNGQLNNLGGRGTAQAGALELHRADGPNALTFVSGSSYNSSGTFYRSTSFTTTLGAPIISASGNSTASSREVTITPADSKIPSSFWEIRYTTDGSNPTASSTKYDGKFPVTTDSTIKAIAIGLRGWRSSAISAPLPVLFNLNPPTVTRSEAPNTGVYHYQPITVSFQPYGNQGSFPGYKVHYTTNGTNPTSSSPAYTPGSSPPIPITEDTKLIFAAFSSARDQSEPDSVEIKFKVAPITLNKLPDQPGPPPFYKEEDPYTVIADSDSPGVSYHYTTNGIDTPGSFSPKATDGVIPINYFTSLKVVGIRSGWAQSDPLPANGSYQYRVGNGSVTFSPEEGNDNTTNELMFIEMESAPGTQIVYTIGRSERDTPDPEANSAGVIVKGHPYVGPVLVKTSPTWIKARSYANGQLQGDISQGQWSNIGNTAPLGEDLQGPAGSVLGSFGGSLSPGIPVRNSAQYQNSELPPRVAVTSLVVAEGVGTLDTSAPHGLSVGDPVFISGVNTVEVDEESYDINGDYVVTEVLDDDTYEIQVDAPDLTANGLILSQGVRVGNWQKFAFIPNAPGIEKVYATGLPGDSEVIRWWFPELDGAGYPDQYVEFVHTILPPDPNEVMVVYHTEGAGIPDQLPVNLSNIPNPVIHYNGRITAGLDEQDQTQVNESSFLWMAQDKRLRASQQTGFAVIEYQDGPSGPFVGMQVVDVRPYQQDPFPNSYLADLGDELEPLGLLTQDPDGPGLIPMPEDELRAAIPLVTRGLANALGESGYIYQHNREGPFDGAVFAVKKNIISPSLMEVVWTRRDRFERAVWPYEIRQYQADWPEVEKMQTYVVNEPGDPVGDRTEIPSPLEPTVMFYQEQASQNRHASIGAGNTFIANRAGLSILKLELAEDKNLENWVGFKVIRSAFRNDGEVFDLEPVDQPIGREIEAEDHLAGFRNGVRLIPDYPGFIYEDEGDRFLPGIYRNNPANFVNPGPGQIFAVNTGTLEVWWHNRFRADLWPDGLKIDWPSMVRRYDSRWPTTEELTVRDEEDNVIVRIVDIADQQGTGAIDPGIFNDWYIYYQNESDERGYNPNDEHAFKLPVQDDYGAFALRNDLGGTDRSEPHLILPYRLSIDPEDTWNLLVFRVEAGDFRYLGTAGTPVQPPLPLNSFTDLERSYALPGYERWWFRDRKNQIWARAGGDTWRPGEPHGPAALGTIVSRYFYIDRPEAGFDYPVGYNARVDGMVPWLDRLAVERNPGHPSGEPIDITYRIRWPDYPTPPAPPSLPEPEDWSSPTPEELLAYERALENFATGQVWRDTVVAAFAGENLHGVGDGSGIGWRPVPELLLGESLVHAKKGLPSVFGGFNIDSNGNPIREGRKSVEILYDQSRENGGGQSVKLIDPTWTYREGGVQLVPAEVKTTLFDEKAYFLDLPPHLQTRLWYEPNNNRLVFTGEVANIILGSDPYYLRLNVVPPADRARILSICRPEFTGASAFRAHLNSLCDKATAVREIGPGTANPLVDEDGDPNFSSFALTAADPLGDGYVTLAFDDEEVLTDPSDPVSLAVIRVADRLFTGELRVQFPPSPFDEKLTIRHSSDFGGRPQLFEVEWQFRPGFLPEDVVANVNQWPATYVPSDWTSYTPTYHAPGEPPRTKPNDVDPSAVVIGGATRETLSDNWFIARYKPLDPAHPFAGEWSDWTYPQLAEGWIKRVMAGINPFEQRMGNYRSGDVDTTVSIIEQIGEQWEGDIPLNLDGIDDLGLLEIYETVMNRGKDLSIRGTPMVDYAPANQALMLAASRIADLYMMLGNEGYADAADPTIAFGTSDGQFGAQASTLHCFMNQTPNLLEEELALLRGRDDTGVTGTRLTPIYNRLPWNLTRDIRGGEVAYVLNYGIEDETWSRFLPDENSYNTLVDDAARMYPQGHGDAWGHYLSASKVYYNLLTNPNFSWVAQPEAVLVGGAPVMVDYEDERRFAKIGAAKARTGAEIVNLTYRKDYTEDPAKSWEGYDDTKEGRHWGVNEWAVRAGQGAFFDWVVGNAIIPHEDPNEHDEGIQKIDRTTVPELAEIASSYLDIQGQLNMADAGMNPLGVASDAVPFDISPDLLTGQNPQTHFEQIYGRAVEGLNNAIRVFNLAFNASQRLREQNDDVATFQRQVEERRRDYASRLIEVFGYPYPGDIGVGKLYPAGYEGPDLFNFMYFEPSELFPGRVGGGARAVTRKFLSRDLKNVTGGSFPAEIEVTLNLSTEGFGFIKPSNYKNPRRAEGEIQMSHREILQSLGRYKRALLEYDNLLGQISEQNRVIGAQAALNAADQAAAQAEVRILQTALQEQQTLNEMITEARKKQVSFQNRAAYSTLIANALAEYLPTSSGLAPDVTSAIRGAIRQGGAVAGQAFSEQAQEQAGKELAHQQAKELVSAQSNLDIVIARNGVLDARANASLAPLRAQLSQLVRSKNSLELEIYNAEEAMNQASSRYLGVLARGQRLLEELNTFLANTASDIQQYRYRDMAFRIFRDEALQKYRAQFDLAGRYVYLAAKAYDYETGLLGSDSRSAVAFLDQIVRSRTIGLIEGGQPVTGPLTGDPGLADAMARMSGSWSVLKGRLGFNNPTSLSASMSLKYEAFRINPQSKDASTVWRETLKKHWVDNLWDVPEFRLHCIPPQGGTASTIPALVIPFETSIHSGFNHFGWPLAGGDHAFPSSHYAVKIKAAGVGFSNYDSVIGGLSATPLVYLVPVGEDAMRVPTDQFTVRNWQIMDQMIPVPFPIGNLEIQDPGYLPLADSLSFAGNAFGRIRKFPEFPAFHDGSGGFNPGGSDVLSSRLIGRSVWNNRWLLIVPGASLKADGADGLRQLIDGRLVNGKRDGNGITDIIIRFDAYSYSGN
nr:chitobiase/beta-hexosaminidase C-terminal domain-containing protein [Luteolibacter marinus]